MAYCGGATTDNAKYLASKTGLDPTVVLAWLRNECQATPNPTNPLNIRYYGTRSQVGAQGGFATYTTTKAGLDDAAWLINNSGYYSGVRAAIRAGDPMQEARSIELSPWAAGHYGGATGPGGIAKLVAQLLKIGLPPGGSGIGAGQDIRAALTAWLGAHGKSPADPITEADATAFFSSLGWSTDKVTFQVGVLKDAGKIGHPWSSAFDILSGIITAPPSVDPITNIGNAISGIGDVLGKLAGFGAGLVFIILGVFIYSKSVRSRVQTEGPKVPAVAGVS